MVAVASAALFAYRVVTLFPWLGSGNASDFWIIICFTGAGVIYAEYAAVSNRSVLVGLLGAAEVFLVTGGGYSLLRGARAVNPTLQIFVAILLVAAFMYPWVRIDRIRSALYLWTGLR